MSTLKLNYKNAGVDLAASDEAKQSIVELARQTHSQHVLHGPGLFGGFFEFPQRDYRQPILVSSIDGVGTKVKLAAQLGHYRGLGFDLVNHCINDVMVGGADPLFFLDYLAFGKMNPSIVQEIVAGLSQACREAGVALLGGETAEMPGVYAPEEFDMAGSITGVVEKDRIIDGQRITAGDVLIGIASNGLHTNGYSLARKIIAENSDWAIERYRDELGETVGESLLRPHRSYLKVIQALRDLNGVHGLAHITGGGIVGNTKRLLRSHLKLQIDWQAWEWPPIFKLLQKGGGITDEEMRSVFNLGIGLVVIVAEEQVDEAQTQLDEMEERYSLIGRVNGKD